MSLPIFFIEQKPTSSIITLSEETSKHVVQVLRMKHGEQLQLTDGCGNLITASITDAHKKACTVSVLETHFTEQKARKICIAISLLKNANRFEWFLEKATEMGVTEIIPMVCHRTEKHHFRHERMKQILVSAMLQSQQVWLPVLIEPVKFNEVIKSSSSATKLVAHCEEEEKYSIRDFAKEHSVQILIGPEGDFTNEEIESALQAGYKPVSLGETRLRAETAGVVAATLLCIQ